MAIHNRNKLALATPSPRRPSRPLRSSSLKISIFFHVGVCVRESKFLVFWFLVFRKQNKTKKRESGLPVGGIGRELLDLGGVEDLNAGSEALIARDDEVDGKALAAVPPTATNTVDICKVAFPGRFARRGCHARW